MARDVVLDTGVLVGFERGQISPKEVLKPGDGLSVCAVTVAELLLGAELAPPERVAAKRAEVEEVLRTMEVLDYDLAVARVHAMLMAHVRCMGQPRGAFDLAIAATAVASRRTLVTTDTRTSFDGLPGLDVEVVGRV
jgi:tRNA(fMet)-specific endonuclease VapC